MSTKLKGQNLRVVLNGEVITAALTATLRLTAQVRDMSTKDTVDWAANEVVDLTWSITAENAVWTGEGSGLSTEQLLDYRGATVNVEMAVTDGEQNAVKQEVMMYGRAIISDIRVTAKNRDRSTCQIMLKGTDAMVIPKWLADVTSRVFETADGMMLTVAG